MPLVYVARTLGLVVETPPDISRVLRPRPGHNDKSGRVFFDQYHSPFSGMPLSALGSEKGLLKPPLYGQPSRAKRLSMSCGTGPPGASEDGRLSARRLRTEGPCRIALRPLCRRELPLARQLFDPPSLYSALVNDARKQRGRRYLVRSGRVAGFLGRDGGYADRRPCCSGRRHPRVSLAGRREK